MTCEDHEELVDALLNLTSAKVLLSGYDHPIYDKLVFHGWNKYVVPVKTRDHQNKPRTRIEVLWTNYPGA